MTGSLEYTRSSQSDVGLHPFSARVLVAVGETLREIVNSRSSLASASLDSSEASSDEAAVCAALSCVRSRRGLGAILRCDVTVAHTVVQKQSNAVL